MKRLVMILCGLVAVLHCADAQVCNLKPGRTNAFTRIDAPSLYRDRVELGIEPTARVIVEFGLGFSIDEQESFQEAARIWGVLLNSAVEVHVSARKAVLDSGILAATQRISVSVNNTVYPRPLGEFLGYEPDSNPDIVVTVNSLYDNYWYLPTDGNTPAGKFDFLTLILHELGHGLAWQESFSVEPTGIGLPSSRHGQLPGHGVLAKRFWEAQDRTRLEVSSPTASSNGRYETCSLDSGWVSCLVGLIGVLDKS